MPTGIALTGARSLCISGVDATSSEAGYEVFRFALCLIVEARLFLGTRRGWDDADASKQRNIDCFLFGVLLRCLAAAQNSRV